MLRKAKRQGVLAYLRVLQGSRRVILAVLFVFAIFQLMLLSFVGALVSGVWLLDLPAATKFEILFVLFATLFGVPALGLAILMSERVWFKASGARKMVEDLQPHTHS